MTTDLFGTVEAAVKSIPLPTSPHHPGEPLTALQMGGKAACWWVRKFGQRPYVASEFWIKGHTGNASVVVGSVKTRNRPLKRPRKVPRVELYATRKAAEHERDRLIEITPLPDYTNPKIIPFNPE